MRDDAADRQNLLHGVVRCVGHVDVVATHRPRLQTDQENPEPSVLMVGDAVDTPPTARISLTALFCVSAT